MKELREQTNQTPFILFTGKGREDVAVKALNLGADSYINKNGSPETVYFELADAINKTVERAETKKQRKKIETELKTSLAKEQFFADLIRNASIAIAVASPDGRLLMANNLFAGAYGL